jgi:hypothetical protein
MTEDEAKTKWCPLVRVSIKTGKDLSITTNRSEWSADPAMREPATKCVGSACMAWRWAKTENIGTRHEKTTDNYCGAFGEP